MEKSRATAPGAPLELGAQLRSWGRRHWIHLLLSPLVFFLFTVVHECAHVLAAYVQGALGKLSYATLFCGASTAIVLASLLLA